MKSPNLLRAVQPFIAVFAVIATASILVVAIYFTLLDLAWIAFLAGILFAGMLAMVSRATRAEYVAASRSAKLALAEDKLLQATERVEKLEAMLASANTLLHFTDQMSPAMLAYIDANGIYRYHNSVFRRWLDLPTHRIDGHHMPEVLGKRAYAQIEPEVTRAFAGETVRYERTHKMVNGSTVRLYVQLLPVIGDRGKPDGIFAILTDVTGRPRSQAPDAASIRTAAVAPKLSSAERTLAAQAQFNTSVAEQATSIPNARERLLAAIERNEFSLFCQLIDPLDQASGHPQYYEILIRLFEEEENMIPPGAFLPLAEESGLLPQLDRWVIANLLHWAAGRQGGAHDIERKVFFINISTPTLCDADFPDYVGQQLYKHELPGHNICFEIADSELASNQGDVDEFVRAVKLLGCKVALSGFGRNRTMVSVLKHLPLDFLKIDGSLILQMHTDPVSMSKIVAINRIAKSIGITTIAEIVEDDATIASLRKIAVDYGQGFGISRPQRLSELV